MPCARLLALRSARSLRRRPAPVGGAAFSILDVETTGLDPEVDRVLEVAVVRMRRDGTISDEFCMLASAPLIGACAVHGITAARVVGEPTFAEVADEVRDRLAGGVVVAGHSVAFDLAFLTSEFRRIDRPLPVAGSLCTMKLGEILGLAPPRTNLARACDHHCIAIRDRHTALGDARATAELLACYLRHAAGGRAHASTRPTPHSLSFRERPGAGLHSGSASRAEAVTVIDAATRPLRESHNGTGTRIEMIASCGSRIAVGACACRQQPTIGLTVAPGGVSALSTPSQPCDPTATGGG